MLKPANSILLPPSLGWDNSMKIQWNETKTGKSTKIISARFKTRFWLLQWCFGFFAFPILLKLLLRANKRKDNENRKFLHLPNKSLISVKLFILYFWSFSNDSVFPFFPSASSWEILNLKTVINLQLFRWELQQS